MNKANNEDTPPTIHEESLLLSEFDYLVNTSSNMIYGYGLGYPLVDFVNVFGFKYYIIQIAS